jgi:hypothetical protein
MLLKLILFCVVMGLIPMIIGMLYIKVQGKASQDSLMCCYIQGVITMWAIFQIVVIPLVFLKRSLTFLVWAYMITIAIVCLVSLITAGKAMILLLRNKVKHIKAIPWQLIVAILLILFQTYMLTAKMHIDDDDAFYVAASTTAIETDSIFRYHPYTGLPFDKPPSRYILSQFFSFIALLAKVTGFHPTVISHTLMPMLLIPMAYMVYALIGSRLFGNKKSAIGNFLIFVSLLQMFSAYSIYTTGVFTLSRIWQGKAVLAGILLPALFYFAIETFVRESSKQRWLGLLMLMFACCLASSMGVFLGALMLLMIALVLSVQKRQAKILWYSLLCCLPNLLYAGLYLMIM